MFQASPAPLTQPGRDLPAGLARLSPFTGRKTASKEGGREVQEDDLMLDDLIPEDDGPLQEDEEELQQKKRCVCVCVGRWQG